MQPCAAHGTADSLPPAPAAQARAPPWHSGTLWCWASRPLCCQPLTTFPVSLFWGGGWVGGGGGRGTGCCWLLAAGCCWLQPRPALPGASPAWPAGGQSCHRGFGRGLGWALPWPDRWPPGLRAPACLALRQTRRALCSLGPGTVAPPRPPSPSPNNPTPHHPTTTYTHTPTRPAPSRPRPPPASPLAHAAWLPDVLMALVRLAPEPPPLR